MKNLRTNLITTVLIILVFMPSTVYLIFSETKGMQYVMLGLMVLVVVGVLGLIKRMDKKMSDRNSHS